MAKKLEPHLTVPVAVWVDVDICVVQTVRALNKIDGVRTHASCQGTLGEDGAEPYPGYVMVSWENDIALDGIRRRWPLRIDGENHGTVFPPAIPYDVVRFGDNPQKYLRQWYQRKRLDPAWLEKRRTAVNERRRAAKRRKPA